MTHKKSQADWSLALDEGIRLFNERHFFECHEVLEDAWREEEGPLRDLYQGLIKLAVAFYHAERGNFEGAHKVLSSGLPQLRPYQKTCTKISLNILVPQLEEWLKRFEVWQREPGTFDLAEVPLIH
ncbi:DUF309 domain-containing protein [Candidatus Acetothermia bacterium]|nr:DUF309 domain-containing protein [Candidatus Acetothermia bacterium]MBI3643451.1 DUF309 domain-containing protein [Candidatus Acetothermia bacterium]